MIARLLPTLALAACAPDIRDTDHDGTPDVAEPDTDTDSDTDTDTDTDTDSDTDTDTDTDTGIDGTVYTEDIDATASDAWVYFAFDRGYVDETDAWTLAVQRYVVQVNGGTSGDGGVTVAPLEGADFDGITEAPADGYTTDSADALVFDTWYVYDATVHVLTAADIVYVVRDGTGDAFKLQFIDYYDDAGNSGHLSFRWAEVAP
jgi:hypothetical protein